MSSRYGAELICYHSRPQVAGSGTASRYGGQLRNKQVEAGGFTHLTNKQSRTNQRQGSSGCRACIGGTMQTIKNCRYPMTTFVTRRV